MSTVVIFRRWPAVDASLWLGDVIALFPYEDEGPGLVNSYMHLGQHSSANYNHVISETRTAYAHEDTSGDPATDVDALQRELERIGYEDLVPRQRRHRR